MRVDNQRSGTNTALLCQLSYHASQLPTTQDKPTRADPSPSRSSCPWSYAGPTFSGWLSLWSPRVKRTRRCFGMQTQHRGESHGSHSLHQHYEYSRLASLFLDGPIQGRNSADPTSIIKPRMVMESWIVQRYTCKSSALSMDSIGNAVLEGLVPGRWDMALREFRQRTVSATYLCRACLCTSWLTVAVQFALTRVSLSHCRKNHVAGPQADILRCFVPAHSASVVGVRAAGMRSCLCHFEESLWVTAEAPCSQSETDLHSCWIDTSIRCHCRKQAVSEIAERTP